MLQSNTDCCSRILSNHPPKPLQYIGLFYFSITIDNYILIYYIYFMDKYNPNYLAVNYFLSPENKIQTKYCALRAFFIDRMSAEEVAEKYGYTKSTVYSLVRDFKLGLINSPGTDPFFISVSRGRKPYDNTHSKTVTILRKNNMSVPEILAAMDGLGMPVSSQFVNSVLKREGFARLPRRDAINKINVEITDELIKIQA